MLGALSKLPLRVIRGVIRRLRPGREAAPEVKLPIRTDPEGPNLKPAVAQSAPAPKVEPVPAPPAETTSAPAPKVVAAAIAPDPVEAAPEPEPTKGRGKRGKGKKEADGAPEPAAEAAEAAEPAAEAAEPATAAAPAAAPAAPVRVRGEATPNPNAMKFSCSVKVIPKGSVTFNTPTAAANHKVGEVLFKINGVRSVFAVNDFVTVTKEDAAGWSTLVPAVEAALVSALST